METIFISIENLRRDQHKKKTFFLPLEWEILCKKLETTCHKLDILKHFEFPCQHHLQNGKHFFKGLSTYCVLY